MRPEQKFKIGDRVRDTETGKVGTITSIYWYEGNKWNKSEWSYSVDILGFYFIGESDLESV